MGGRGSSSGVSVAGNPYGSQYRTILESGNIKFVTKNSRTSETLMETMTEGRLYVSVGGKELKSITYFDSDNRRIKTIDLDHSHKGIELHAHHGYFHNELDGLKGAGSLTPEERKMVERVYGLWDNYLSR